MNRTPGIQLDLNESFPHLAAAPIVEAVIHFRARASNWPEPAQLRKTLEAQLPRYPECRPQHQWEMEAEFTEDGPATQTGHMSWLGFRLFSEDKLHVVQFMRDGIVFSRLTPYENWDVFAAEAWRLWRVFAELTAPTEVQRLGARFINRIALGQPEDVRRYLKNPPECLEAIDLPTVGFLYQSRHEVPGHAFNVNVVRTLQPPNPQEDEKFGLIVDIDVGTTHALACEEAILKDRLKALHWLKNKVFFDLCAGYRRPARQARRQLKTAV